MGKWVGRGLVALAAVLLVSQLFIRNDGVGFVSGLVVFLIAWWTVLFAILPRDVRGQYETGEVVEGSEPGAPVDPQLKRKAWLTTVVTAGLWLVFFGVVEFALVDVTGFMLLPNAAEG